jgi:hypothetical protein
LVNPGCFLKVWDNFQPRYLPSHKLLFPFPLDQQRTRRMAHHVLRHAAEQEMFQPGVSVRSHYDKISGLCLRCPANLVRQDTVQDQSVYLQKRVEFGLAKKRNLFSRLLQKASFLQNYS